MDMPSSNADLKNNKNNINKEEEEIQQLGGVIIWSSEHHNDNCRTGWTRDRWNHCKDKKLFYTGKITHVSYNKSLLLLPWATSYECIQIAFYQNPNLILILKHPKQILFLSTQPSKKELLLEAIIDPAVCKLRLSNWTTPSSIHYLSSSEHHQPNNFHKSCFELVTPTQVWTFSVLSPQILKRSSSGDTAMPKEQEEQFIRDTCMWEAMFSQALLYLHQPISNDNNSNKVIPDFYSWRHAFILGTLHSYVVTCDKDMLQLSLQQLSKNNVSVNSLDEYGLAPLHYACNQRDSVAVGLLVKAGAEPTIPIVNKDYLLSSTCCHICAVNLDSKSLSVLLSAPSRPDPNALDEYGRTPMYVAAVEGVTVAGRNNKNFINSCLESTLGVLAKWGGRYLDEISPLILQHPVFILSSLWQATKLSVVFPHDKPHLVSSSLGHLYGYPLHAAILTLRKQIAREILGTKNKQCNNTAVSSPREEQGEDCDNLAETLRVLLNHGLEPNERCFDFKHNLKGEEDNSLESLLESSIIGLTPVQVLAICALEGDAGIQKLILDNTMDEEETMKKRATIEKLLEQLMFATEVLIYCGARINMDSHPSKLCSETSSTSVSDGLFLMDKVATSSAVTMLAEGNGMLLNLLGGKERLHAAQTSWSLKGSIPAYANMELRPKPSTDDSTACAVCWKPFGKIRNRKHWCRASHKFVCDECSSKRIIRVGDELRVSDGQYLLACFRNNETTAKAAVPCELALEVANNASNVSIRSKQHRSTVKEEDESRDELFGGLNAIGKTMMNFLSGTDDEDTADQTMSGLTTTLGQTRDALNERGSKLRSLSEKTSALADASKDFAAMAKALKESQQKANAGFFW